MPSITLTPSGAGALTQCSYLVGAATNWQAVLTNDSGTSYVGGAWPNDQTDYYAQTASGVIPAGSIISAVTVYVVSSSFASSGSQTYPALRTNGTNYLGSYSFNGAAWTAKFYAWTVNPNTGSAWTISEISALQIGHRELPGSYYAFATQVYAIVDYYAPPIVTTENVTAIVTTTATGNGTITDIGDSAVTEHGHVWGLNVNPTTALATKTTLGAVGTGAFTSSITGLTIGTKYRVRAYATNGSATAYGSDVTFIAGSSRAGQIWMEGSNLHGFDENAVERTYIHTGNLEDAPVDGSTNAISSNWAYDHVAAADPHTGYRLESADHSHQSTGLQAGKLDHGLALDGLGDDDHTQYVLKSTYDAQTILAATSDNTPAALTVGEQTLVGRITGGNIAALTATQVRTLLGVPYLTDQISLTAQTADIADTAFAGNTAGLYRLAFYILDTTADVTAGAVTLNIKFTDNAAARTISTSPVVLTATTGYAQGNIVVRLASGTITYGVTHTGIFGTASYALYLTLERII